MEDNEFFPVSKLNEEHVRVPFITNKYKRYQQLCMYVWMDGWIMDRSWINGYRDGWMCGWMDAWMDAWMHGWMDG